LGLDADGPAFHAQQEVLGREGLQAEAAVVAEPGGIAVPERERLAQVGGAQAGA
jgi:hypothetical protein